MALKNIFCVLVFLILIANFAYAADAVIAYRSDSGNGTAYPKLRFWNSSGTGTWGPEIELPDSGSDADYVIIRSSPARNKLVVITLGGDRYLDAYACTSSCTQPASWTLTTNIGQVENVANTRRFDFNFEKSTGDMVLVYSVLSSDGSRDLAYKMLPDDQTNFSGLSEYYIDDTGHAGDSDYSWVELDRKKTGTSQELALVALDSTHDDVNAWIWNGSAFGNYAEISSDISKAGNPQRREALAVKYTYISGNAMAIGGYGSSGDFNYRIWNGSVWSSVASFDSDPANGEDIEWASMKADPSSDYLQAVLQTSASDLDTAFWNGSAWFNTTDISTSLSGSGATRPADFAWNPTGSTGLLVWGESPGEMKWRTCSPECNGTIMTDTSFSSNTRFVVNSRNPTSDDYVKIIGVRIINSGNGEIGSYSWNGTNISNYGDSVITLSSGTQNVEIAFSLESQAYYDILAPQVNLVSPANSSTILGNSVNLTFNTTDDIATALNCSLFLDGILNMTNGSVANGTDTGFQVAGIPSGLHNWSVSCTDQGNNTGVSETWYFTMDSGPQVTLNAPANNSYTNSSIVSFNFTASDNFATTLNCSLYLDGSLNQYYPTVSNGTPHVFSVGPMSDGSYYWNVSCKDNSNLTGWSQTRYFTVDTTNPQLSIQHPQNITYNVWTVPLNYIASDNIGAPTCFLYIDGISYGELPGCVNATIAGFSDGAHNVTMYVNDSAGNSNSSTVSFTIDTSAPIIALNSPPEGYATNSTTVEFNFTATDNLSPTMNCSLYVDGSLLQYNPSIANNTPMIFSQLLSQGQYNWTITCTDGANNTAASETRNLTVDASAPVVSIQSPANTTYAVPDIDLNFTVTDNLGVSSCWYYLNGAGPTMLPGCANTTLNSLTNGHYNLTVFANDSANNTAYDIEYFTVDSQYPIVSIQSPANASYTTTSLDLNFTVSGQDSCWYVLNFDAPVYGCSNTTITAAEGSNNVTVYANNSIGNASSSVNFFVDSLLPAVTIILPTNTVYTSLPIPLNFTAFDHNLDSCWYTIDNGLTPVDLPGCANTTFSVVDGIHNVTVYANDSLNNTGSALQTFTVNVGAPLVNIQSPQNITYDIPNPMLNYTAADAGLDSCWFVIDNGAPNYSISSCTNTTLPALSDGSHNVTVYANDSSNNIGLDVKYFSVDTSPPAISIQSPANTTYTVSSVALDYTVTDNLGVSSCWYYLNGAGPTMLPGCANTTLNSLTNGHYNLTVFANDSADNQNSSTVFFTINVAAPPPIIIPSGDGGEDKDELNLSWEQVCPENGMLVNVRSDGSTVSGVEVRLLLQDPYYGLIDQQDSNESGQVMFNTDITGTYWIYAHGSGYYSFGPLEAEYTACEPEVTEGCDVDSDCASTETCEGGTCTQVECECGMIEDRTCVPYECCSDTECSEGEVCTGNQCVIEPGCTTDSDCADEETCSSEICIPVETGECGYVQNHSWQDYECCQDSECADYPYEKCTSHTCGPRTYTLKVLSETVTAGSEARIAVIEDDERMANARISIMSPSGKTFEGYTDENGEFVFTPDAKGTYTASAFGSDGRTLAKADVMAGEASTPCCLFSLCSFLGLSQLFGICWYWWILLLIIIAAIIILYLVYREIQKGGTKRKWKGPRGPKK